MAEIIRLDFPEYEKIVPDAYHGTDVANVESIKANGFQIGTGSDLYLGDGIYFYEGSKWHAANFLKQGNPTCKIALYRCVINLGRCLDLNNEDHKQAVVKFASQVRFWAADNQAFCKKWNIKSPNNITVSFIINLAAQLSKADTVRAPFAGQNPLISGSAIGASHIPAISRLVIAVRTPNKILETVLESVET